MGLKEKILEIIKKSDGISHNDIKLVLKEKPYNIELKHENQCYSYLSRLKGDHLIEPIIGYVNRKKHYTYKATLKAFNKGSEQQNSNEYLKLLEHTKKLQSIMYNKMKFTEDLNENERNDVREVEELIKE